MFFHLLHGLEAALRSWEIKVHMTYLEQILDTVFINAVIYIYLNTFLISTSYFFFSFVVCTGLMAGTRAAKLTVIANLDYFHRQTSRALRYVKTVYRLTKTGKKCRAKHISVLTS